MKPLAMRHGSLMAASPPGNGNGGGNGNGNGNGNGAINANVQNLNAGIYKYSLIIDGRIIDTKTMIISK